MATLKPINIFVDVDDTFVVALNGINGA